MRKPRLTDKRAVWLGLVATPVLVVAAVATIGVAGSSAGPTTSKATPTADSAVVVHRETVSAAGVYAYWTPQRMAAAEAMVNAMPSSAGKPEIAGDTATGPPGFAGGVTPSGQQIEAPSPTEIPSQTSGGQLPADGSYPGPMATFKWYPRYLTHPQGTVGKMFFDQDHDGNGTLSSFACSAAVIKTGPRNDAVLTAGHCVNSGRHGEGANQGWSTNILFCPSYLNGPNPARGCWAGDGNVLTHQSWIDDHLFDVDYGWFGTATPGTVHAGDVATITGGLGFAWNVGRDQLWWNWGYPAQPVGAPWSFNGGALVLCTGEHRYDRTPQPGEPVPPSNSMGCGSGRGADGGPWVTSVNQGSAVPTFANSVNSWIVTVEEGFEIQGPYFDGLACLGMKFATEWPGDC
jgi:hypothetical protein